MGRGYPAHDKEVDYMLNADVIFSLISFSVALWYYIESLKFPPGVGNVPGPAFYPQLVFYVWVLLSLILFISGVRKRKVYFSYKLSDSRTKRGILVIVLTFLYLFLWGHGRFVLNTTIYLGSVMLILGEKIVQTIIASLVISIFVYYVFNKLFNVLLF